MNIIFFPGDRISNYKPYFPMFNLLNSNEYKQTDEIRILCHGYGILQAIEWCEQKKITPNIIVSMDGSSLKDITGIEKYKIYLLRQTWKRNLKDITYPYVIYYSGNNHHPYMNINLRDMISSLLLKN